MLIESYDEAARVRNLILLLSQEDSMKRDDDLIRRLMFEIEANPDPISLLGLTHDMEPDERIEYYHLKLLADEGMLEESGKTGGVWRMTMKGHDFVAVVRDDTIWNRSKGALASVGGFTVSMLKDVATGYVRQKLIENGVPLS
ncbi:DUF2513 domain-containing protein [Falsirhodobacter sp. 1013]|uniref:DUF2513 domain-containing protein n=1 Tax=Falsirhodobacter sp. 1013 TaxID=3417566 RepID=UPI003EBFF62A